LFGFALSKCHAFSDSLAQRQVTDFFGFINGLLAAR
jgi:hypothetical protein